jgi:paraquat-inducible protein B
MEAVLANVNSAVTSLNSMLASQGAQRLPQELSDSLSEIRRMLEGFSPDSPMYQDLNSSLENINRLTQELADKPNALIFAPQPKPDLIPEARQ